MLARNREVHYRTLHPAHAGYVLLGYYVMWFGEEEIKFRSNILPQSSEQKIQQVHKRWYRLAILHGAITQTTKTLILTKTLNITSLATRLFSFTSICV